jgi:hypothetical protein
MQKRNSRYEAGSRETPALLESLFFLLEAFARDIFPRRVPNLTLSLTCVGDDDKRKKGEKVNKIIHKREHKKL